MIYVPFLLHRKLAKDLDVPWTEYWQFLDAFADFSTQDGLQKLDQHLSKQQAVLTILAAMKTVSSNTDGGGSASDSSSGVSGSDSQLEGYFSCDEGSGDEKVNNSSSVARGKCRTSEVVELAGKDYEDVFEDSVDHFYDTRGYVFGQRLQLKKNNNNKAQLEGKERKVPDGSGVDNPKTREEKTGGGNSNLWSYRDNVGSEEGHRLSETSTTSDTTHSFDATSPSPDVQCHESDVDQQTVQRKEEGKKNPATEECTPALEKSFNTVMTELSEDLEARLVFSPDGKVQSRKGRLAPDIGLCLGREVFAEGVPTWRRGECPLDVVIKARKDCNTFLADVLVHSSHTNVDSDDEFSDDSIDDFPNHSKQNVVKDVTMVAKSAAVFKHVWRVVHPVLITVGVLKSWEQDITEHCGCVTARIVRRKRSKSRQTAFYIYGYVRF